MYKGGLLHLTEIEIFGKKLHGSNEALFFITVNQRLIILFSFECNHK